MRRLLKVPLGMGLDKTGLTLGMRGDLGIPVGTALIVPGLEGPLILSLGLALSVFFDGLARPVLGTAAFSSLSRSTRPLTSRGGTYW